MRWKNQAFLFMLTALVFLTRQLFPSHYSSFSERYLVFYVPGVLSAEKGSTCFSSFPEVFFLFLTVLSSSLT